MGQSGTMEGAGGQRGQEEQLELAGLEGVWVYPGPSSGLGL